VNVRLCLYSVDSKNQRSLKQHSSAGEL